MTGSIHTVIQPGWYLVKDNAGRLHRATSQELWRKGAMVTVIDGQVIGLSGKGLSLKVYEV